MNVLEFLEEVSDVGNDLVRLIQKKLSGFRDANGAGGPLKQGHAEFCFDRLNSPSQCTGRDIELSRCGGEACGGPKHLEKVQISEIERGRGEVVLHLVQ